MATNRGIKRRGRRRTAWGAMAGLLTACVVTLIGLFVELDPHIILGRACLAGVVMGVIVSFGVSVIYIANASS